MLFFQIGAYKVGYLLLSPELILAVFALFWGLGKYNQWERLQKSMIIAAAGFLTLITIIPIPQWGLSILEKTYCQPKLINVTGIIFLGGSFNLPLSKERHMPCYNQAGGRLIESLSLAQKHQNLKLVFSGGGAVSQVTEADLVKSVMKDLNIPHEKIIFESKSRNTEENAAFTKELIKPKKDEHWLLVTSAYHMPRSIMAFKKHGWDVTPYPVDYHANGKIQWIKLPQFEKDFLVYKTVMREVLGILNYVQNTKMK